MNFDVKFTYAYGSVDNIKQGNSDDMRCAGNITSLEIDREADKSIVPRFIGVYQVMTVHTDEAESEMDVVRLCKRKEEIDARLREGMTLQLRVRDTAFPELIHIIYDGTIWSREMVIREVADETKRIKISPYSRMPKSFDGKRRAALYFNEVARMALEKREEGFAPPEIAESLKFETTTCTNVMRKYGMTTSEYAFFRALADPAGARTRLFGSFDLAFS